MDWVPEMVNEEAETWQGLIEEHGIGAVQGFPHFKDHPLKGKLRRSGVCSVSPSYGFRIFYRILMGEVECVLVEEVNNHDYKRIERLFGK